MAERDDLDGSSGGGLPGFVSDPVGVLRRRWMPMAITFCVASVAAVFVVLFFPERYEAAGRLLISGQSIRDEFVRSTIAEGVLEQLNAMVGEVISRESLLQIAETHELAEDLGEKRSEDDVLAKLGPRDLDRAGRLRADGQQPGRADLRGEGHLAGPRQGGGRRQRRGEPADRGQPRAPQPPGAPRHRLPAPGDGARRGLAEGPVGEDRRVQGALPRRAAERAGQQDGPPRAAPVPARRHRPADVRGGEPTRDAPDAGRRERSAHDRAPGARAEAAAREDREHARAPERAGPPAPGRHAACRDGAGSDGRRLVADPARSGRGRAARDRGPPGPDPEHRRGDGGPRVAGRQDPRARGGARRPRGARARALGQLRRLRSTS